VPSDPVRVPPFRCLFSNLEILTRARELTRELQSSLAGPPPCLVQVVEGARPFARLVQLGCGAEVMHDVRAKSYEGTVSTGSVQVEMLGGFGAMDVVDREVVLIEDIVDTGRTVEALRAHFLALGAKRVRVVALLSKPSRRVVDVEVEHIGFEIPDEFVIGFGMDLDERYRELPDIVVYDAEVERGAAASEA